MENKKANWYFFTLVVIFFENWYFFTQFSKALFFARSLLYTLSIRCRFEVLKAERIGGIYRDKTYFYEIKPIMPFIPHYHRTVSRPLTDPIFMGVQKS